MNHRKVFFRIFILQIFFITLSNTKFYASDSTKIWQNFAHDLGLLRSELTLPGMSVAVILDQQIAFSKGFGFADLENEISATVSTLYHICSLTKPFSSVLIMQLVETGALSLESKMRDLCKDSDFNINGEIIHGYDSLCKKLVGLINHPCENYDFTIRHHLSHTARGVPGEKYRYSGWLFGMLTKAVEAVSEQEFSSLLTQKITARLKLSNTFPNESANRTKQILEQRAKPYQITKMKQLKFSRYPAGIRASAGMVSNVFDLARFDIAVDKYELITKESTEKMWTPATLNNGSKAPYGLGWYVQETKKFGRVVWHSGWQPDMYSALYLKVPSANATFIMLANGDGASTGFELSLGNVKRSPFAKLFFKLLSDLQRNKEAK